MFKNSLIDLGAGSYEWASALFGSGIFASEALAWFKSELENGSALFIASHIICVMLVWLPDGPFILFL
jgi:hypothetical protein